MWRWACRTSPACRVHRQGRAATPRAALVAFAGLAAALPAAAQDDPDRLAKQLSNPVASLISLPLQLNTDFGYGDEDGTRSALNIQPVIPKSLGERWNLITRVILPVVHQDDVVPGTDQFGLGDTTPTFFYSPKAPGPGGLIWAVGPVFLLPTATDDRLGTEKWGIGPSALALVQTEGGLSYGALVNHLESVAGDEARADLSSTFVQPFFARQFSGGRTLTFNLESTYDWEHEQWTVPLNVQFSKVTKLGSQMASFGGGVRAFLEKPEGGPDWGVRFVMTLLFPQH